MMKVLKIPICLVVAALALGAFCVPDCLASFSGSLTTTAGGGLVGVGDWADVSKGVLELSWVVTNMTTYWNYEYTFDIDDNTGALSSFVVEVSPGVVVGEITGLSGASNPEVQTWDSEGFFSDAPGPLNGLKVTGFGENGPWTISFNSVRAPVWGDFYAKDGQFGAVWNSGYSAADPDVALHNGPEQGHLLVPDTHIIPAPGAVLLGGIGVCLVGWLRRRRML